MLKTVLLGGTGLIGRQVLSKTSGLTVLSRKDIPEQARRHHIVVANNLLDISWPEHSEQVICCLGTTLKKAGDQDSFINQDFLLPRTLLERAIKQGAKRLLIISAVGADPDSRVFYSRIKGELESAVANMGWEQVVIYQPSLLLGTRINDARPTEWVSQLFGKVLAPIVPSQWRPIQADALADRLVFDAQSPLKANIEIVKGQALWRY